MSESVKEIKDFAKVEAEALHKEIMFYYNTQTRLSYFNKGMLYGKKMAYDKILNFINATEHSQEDKNEN